jgi:hypothetical protein
MRVNPDCWIWKGHVEEICTIHRSSALDEIRGGKFRDTRRSESEYITTDDLEEEWGPLILVPFEFVDSEFEDREVGVRGKILKPKEFFMV